MVSPLLCDPVAHRPGVDQEDPAGTMRVLWLPHAVGSHSRLEGAKVTLPEAANQEKLLLTHAIRTYFLQVIISAYERDFI